VIRTRRRPCPEGARSPRSSLASWGFTMLELMVVIAIVGLLLVVFATRLVTGPDLAEEASKLEGYLRRAGQLALEHGEQHRVLIDLEEGRYVVEVCQGAATLARNEQVQVDQKAKEAALTRGTERLRDLPQDALAVGDPDEATRRAIAIAGHHVADRQCVPPGDGAGYGATGYVDPRVAEKAKSDKPDEESDWNRKLHKDVKFREIWVQHREDSTTRGQIAVYFFPDGSSEKAVIELVAGKATRTIVIHGLTGRVQQKTGKLDNVDDHMLRNALGERDKAREGQR
jgi:prepilin-type N-terminal cleavage/methylation domain-containing protein